MRRRKFIDFILICLVGVLILFILLTTVIFYIYLNSNDKIISVSSVHRTIKNSYLTYDELILRKIDKNNPIRTKCSMSTCFNFKKCTEDNFKIYVYKNPAVILSNIFAQIISILLNSNYYTPNPEEACLFVASLDTLDRDKLSKNFVKNLNSLIRDLPFWNNGTNHLIFNLYSGSWPNYVDNLEFEPGNAVLVKASFSVRYYRKDFDISFPLFHAELPYNSSLIYHHYGYLQQRTNKKYLLSFKGKRYLHGIGSETRDSLYHLNNKRDIILLTTCKHGYNWQELKDSRCDIDNYLYEKCLFLNIK